MSVAVDLLVFTIEDDRLKILLIERSEDPFKNAYALPGVFVGIKETLDDAAQRGIKEETGLSDIYFEQLYTFGDVKRDPRMRIISVSYMALVPIIQPPIMKALTTREERLIRMPQLRNVTKIEKIAFPLIVLLLCALLLPSAVPLIGALMLGNLAKEVGASVSRIADTMSNALINIVTIMLGLSVGSKLACEMFLSGQTLAILALGLCAFCVGTAAGVIMAKIMNLFCRKENRINPLIGSAGVSAVPMAARVSNKVALTEDPTNYVLMQAMGPNVSGVIGSAVVAGVLYTLCR